MVFMRYFQKRKLTHNVDEKNELLDVRQIF